MGVEISEVLTLPLYHLPHKRRIAAFTTSGEAQLLCVLQAATAGSAKKQMKKIKTILVN